jgi:hypothetical protein
MQPRLVFRTHYQVDEPAYMEFLIKLCTSGVQSTYTEVVARKLTQDIRTRCKNFNEAAGCYAVDLASALGLLTPNNAWTDKGFLVDLIAEVNDGEPEEQLSLTLPEKLLHFRIFLESDGAAFLFLARYLTQHNSLPRPDTTANSLAQEMFIEILSDYLSATSNTADRVALRKEVERLRRKGYRGNSGSHKLFVHAQTLYRIGLIARRNTTSRGYHLPGDSQGVEQGLGRLLRKVPDIFALEEIVTAHRLIEIAAYVLPISYTPWGVEQRKETLSLLAQFYRRTVLTGAPLCFLSTLIEATQIALLTKGVLLRYDEALALITEIQQKHPKEVRFHVDRRGQPAFVKMSDEMVKVLADE